MADFNQETESIFNYKFIIVVGLLIVARLIPFYFGINATNSFIGWSFLIIGCIILIMVDSKTILNVFEFVKLLH
jgi:hypothetical protein